MITPTNSSSGHNNTDYSLIWGILFIITLIIIAITIVHIIYLKLQIKNGEKND